MISQVLKNQDKFDANIKELNNLISSHSTSIKQLESQFGKIASTLNPRQKGTLPSDMVGNPRNEGVSHCLTISTRSGKVLEESKMPMDIVDRVAVEKLKKSDEKMVDDFVLIEDKSDDKEKVDEE
ncbi:hypothetical protein RND71_015740 [Anisodus tanguticus]|uniref:Uncharacterized protein n=1 Tax=Anisodus tanguticus TaxID=243964 RepID=A0AAE1S7N5_9SOLA|nr:hypothetical protein RND71_015740 [Anisodus tanguticus]